MNSVCFILVRGDLSEASENYTNSEKENKNIVFF